jgi:hypothetical protein
MNASPFAGYTSIDDQGAAATFTKVAAGTALAIDAATGGAVTYQLADSSGATDTVAITLGMTAARAALLGTAATAGGFTVASTLTLADNTFGGIGNVNFTINNTTPGSSETITTLNDGALTSLTIAGTGDQRLYR